MLKLVILRGVLRKASLKDEELFDVKLGKASKGYKTDSRKHLAYACEGYCLEIKAHVLKRASEIVSRFDGQPILAS